METVDENVEVVADAQQTGEETEPADGFYKSQQEVDYAFSKRIAAEREKWEKEHGENAQQTGEEEQSHQENPDAEDLSHVEQEQFIDGVLQAEREIIEQDPDFDLAHALEDNPLFALMVAQGQDVKKVYDYFYPQANEGRLRKNVEKEIFEKIRMRNNRPEALRVANAGKVTRDISNMSDSEIMEIDERIKRGERIVL